MRVTLFYTLSVISLLVFADKLPADNLKNYIQKNNSNNGFIENKGQITDQFSNPRPDILFKFEQKNLQLFFRQNGFSYQLRAVKTSAQKTSTIKTDLQQVTN